MTRLQDAYWVKPRSISWHKPNQTILSQGEGPPYNPPITPAYERYLTVLEETRNSPDYQRFSELLGETTKTATVVTPIVIWNEWWWFPKPIQITRNERTMRRYRKKKRIR